MFKKYLSTWYYYSLGIAAATVIVLVAFWGSFTVVQRLMLGMFIVIQLHFFEEFGYPGGFQYIGNVAECNSDHPDYYPLNQRSAAFGNNWVAFFAFLLPVFLPDVTWLVMGTVVFAVLELAMHLGFFNVKLRRWYNPGLATTLLGLVPLAIAYLAYALPLGMVSGWDWFIAFAWALFHYLFSFHFVGKRFLGGKRYAFTPDEMARFDRYIAKTRK